MEDIPFRASLLAAGCGVGLAMVPVAFGAEPDLWVLGTPAAVFGLLPFAFVGMSRERRVVRRLGAVALGLAVATAAVFAATRTGPDSKAFVFAIAAVFLFLVNDAVLFMIEGLIVAFTPRRPPARPAEDRWLS